MNGSNNSPVFNSVMTDKIQHFELFQASFVPYNMSSFFANAYVVHPIAIHTLTAVTSCALGLPATTVAWQR